MINVRHLAVFRAVMQMGTVSGAARMLNVSQPAVTKSLQLLESHLGVTLFERVKGRLKPAGDSEILMPEIDRLFSMILSVEQLAEEVRRGHKGHVAIATVGTLASSLVASAVAVWAGGLFGAVAGLASFVLGQIGGVGLFRAFGPGPVGATWDGADLARTFALGVAAVAATTAGLRRLRL